VMVLMALLVTHSLLGELIYGLYTDQRDKEHGTKHEQHVPRFGNPRLNPFLLSLVDGYLQTVALAGTLWVTRPVADGAVRSVVPIHDYGLCLC